MNVLVSRIGGAIFHSLEKIFNDSKIARGWLNRGGGGQGNMTPIKVYQVQDSVGLTKASYSRIIRKICNGAENQ